MDVFNLIYEHSDHVLGSLVRLTRNVEQSEDVLQDAIIRVIEKSHQFKGKTDNSFKWWFTRIALNLAKNKHRRKINHALPLKEEFLGSYDDEPDLDMYKISNELSYVIETLPSRQRKALILRIYKDMSFKEIAQEMGCKYDTAKANYRHAITNLRGMVNVGQLPIASSYDPFWSDHLQY